MPRAKKPENRFLSKTREAILKEMEWDAIDLAEMVDEFLEKKNLTEKFREFLAAKAYKQTEEELEEMRRPIMECADCTHS